MLTNRGRWCAAAVGVGLGVAGVFAYVVYLHGQEAGELPPVVPVPEAATDVPSAAASGGSPPSGMQGGEIERSEDEFLADLVRRRPSDVAAAQWDSWAVDTVLTDRRSVSEGVESLPWVTEVQVAQEDKQALEDVLCEFLLACGTESFSDYFAYLERSGEVIAEDIEGEFRRTLEEYGGVPRSEQPSDPWEVARQFCSDIKPGGTEWRGLVVKHSEVRVFETAITDLPELGKHFRLLCEVKGIGRHISKPPMGLKEALALDGTCRVADVTLYVAHSDRLNAVTRPYMLRFWYDSRSKVWRPLTMSSFQGKHDRLMSYIVF